LVDVENLIGHPRPTLTQAANCCDLYEERAAVRSGDLIVVACNHGAALAVGLGWKGARLLLRSGQDGADRALLEVIAHETVEDRFASVVVASGDGCFAEPVASLGAIGLDVTIVSRPPALSRRLELAARRVVVFDAEPVPAQPAEVALKAA
jgi:hypothetical protein